MGTNMDFDAAVRRHDALLSARGHCIWVGSEPTFTDRWSQAPEWVNQALGGAKEERARTLLRGLCQRQPGGLVLRSVGRRYPGETQPRWNLGVYRLRDGAPLWSGPPDPLLVADRAAAAAPDLDVWAAALVAALLAVGLQVSALAPQSAQQVSRSLRVEVPAADALLLVLSVPVLDGQPTAWLDLPLVSAVPQFLALLEAVAQSCRACRLPTLVLAGQTPPVDARVELTTVTPDPAVIEINTAPSVDAQEFLWRSREIYAVAADERLTPYRLYFNGSVADSGGGGQITLGGPTPSDSPFLREPQLLARLVRFINRHPALSYLYAHDFVGSSGQSVRADERGNGAFDELVLALHLLDRRAEVSPELLWHSLAPFLCDAAGNSHRAELNIEKLWNPFLDGRGQLGLVEFRALRMQHTPERATALACLLRAMVAMLAAAPFNAPLIEWGRELHERFALPYYLENDLDEVLRSLDEAGLGLDAPLQAELRRDEFRRWGEVDLPGCRLEVRRALEFWPLLGDAASPEQGGASRLMDASTARVELRIRPTDADAPGWRDWQLTAAGVELPMRPERDAQGEVRVFGLRYRAFVPRWGLHPALESQAPLRLRLRHPEQPTDTCITLHEWRPDGQAYTGLPEDLAQAAARRAERISVEPAPQDSDWTARVAPSLGLGPYHLDLRCLT